MIENPFVVEHHPDPLLGAWQVRDTRTNERRATMTLRNKAASRALALWHQELAARPKPKLSKTLKHLEFTGCYIGNTADLLHLVQLGYDLRYDLGETQYLVVHAPRSTSDPKPWVQIGGLESRLSSGEIGAY